MTFYVTNQNTVVLVLFLFGAFFAFLRDIIRVKRSLISVCTFVEAFEDFLYCVVFAFAYRVTVFVANYGYVRWYEICACAGGFAFYRLVLSVVVTKMLRTVILATVTLIRKVFLFLSSPFVFVAKKLYRMLCKKMQAIHKKVEAGMIKHHSDVTMRKQLKSARYGFYPKKRKDL